MTLQGLNFIAAAIFAMALAIAVYAGRARGAPNRLLIAALLADALWATAAAYQGEAGTGVITQIFEALRSFVWLALFVSLLLTAFVKQRIARRGPLILTSLGILAVGFIALIVLKETFGYRLGTTADVVLLAAHLLLAAGGLTAIEQVYRNTPTWKRPAVKYLCIGVGAIFAYDFYLYADALLLTQINPTIWSVRGFAHLLVIPIISIAVMRGLPQTLADTSADLLLSRRAVLHTAALVGAGLYLLIMGTGGYYVREYGGSWGGAAQLAFFFGATLVLAVLLFSGQLRAQLNVFISKHFLRYKYDYRNEWLRFIQTISADPAAGCPRERVIRAIAQITTSPSGVLWLRDNQGNYEPAARWNRSADLSTVQKVPGSSSLVTLLEQREWVINLDEHLVDNTVGEIPTLPEWLRRDAWLVVPLMLRQQLYGFIVLARSPLAAVRRHFDWEDYDLLKTAGRGAASALAELDASRALAEARQFETFNRLSAFVVHDIKGLISQLSLVVTNATRHRHRPEFMEDAVLTIENSIDKMNRLLDHLRTNNGVAPASEYVNLNALVTSVVQRRAFGRPISLIQCHRPRVGVFANHDRLAAVVGHLLQNACDATPHEGKIQLRLDANDSEATIEVEDSGCGMDETFLRECLFRPFTSTKSTGMGVGMYETREFVRSLGGRIDVDSRVGHGTLVRLILPLHPTPNNVLVYPRPARVADNEWQAKPQSFS